MKVLIRYGAYPIVLTLGVLGHLWCLRMGLSLPVATYIPIVLGALLIMGFEWMAPFRCSWGPDMAALRQDAIFMVVVQGMLPLFLSFAVSLTLLEGLNLQGEMGWSLWPHYWPVVAQMGLMMVLADGLRYGLHRVAHEWRPLWRFHAVHHSPHILYWLNVGRFHPVDKGVQFLFDSLPFLILGIGEEVLAFYMVCYALNGFFQHCNIDVRLGWLNYVISGPELHRWHHSKWPEESNHNYGNNLIVWDLVFGTWYLPQGRMVEELGLINRAYPMTFFEQVAVPFTSEAEPQTTVGL